LGSPVRCTRCGQRYIGNAAHGKTGKRYRYYTCYSRQRYGTSTCSADRLPADQLERAVLNALLATYRRADLFERAIAQAHRRTTSHHHRNAMELVTTQAKLRQTAQAMDRYLAAFEQGTMPTDLCGPRLESSVPGAPSSRPANNGSGICWPPTPPQAPTRQPWRRCDGAFATFSPVATGQPAKRY
jgi:site-specific DNA recombinase